MNEKSSRELRKSKPLRNLYWLPMSLAIFIMGTILFVLAHFLRENQRASKSYNCSAQVTVNVRENQTELLQGYIHKNLALCYEFKVESQQKLIINTTAQIKLNYRSLEIEVLPGDKFEQILPEAGNYSIIIDANKSLVTYKIELRIEPQSVAKKPELPSEALPTPTSQKPISPNLSVQLTYNAINPPPFKSDRRLQGIVNGIVSFAKSRDLPIESLSISLIDLSPSQSQCCAYASYLDDRRRYPASVVKLFWMVASFGQYQADVISPGTISEATLTKMIQDSDNEAASMVLDAITNTESGAALPPETIKIWQAKRYSLNKFFERSGYRNINISQKTFPLPYLKMNGPAGRDLQLRDKNLQIREKPVNPIRNYLTTYSVARLLYEIRADLSISEYYSNEMDSLLWRDLRPEAWQNKPYNAIEGFLGEYLPENAHLASKMGWTSSNRNDAAIIASPDRKTHYILIVFGDHPSFYKDKKFLPEISQLVYQQMKNWHW